MVDNILSTISTTFFLEDIEIFYIFANETNTIAYDENKDIYRNDAHANGIGWYDCVWQ